MTIKRFGKGRFVKRPGRYYTLGKNTLSREAIQKLKEANYPALMLLEIDPSKLVLQAVLKKNEKGDKLEDYTIYVVDQAGEKQKLSDLISKKMENIPEIHEELFLRGAISAVAVYELGRAMELYQHANNPEARRFYRDLPESSGLFRDIPHSNKTDMQKVREGMQKAAQMLYASYNDTKKFSNLLETMKANMSDYDVSQSDKDDIRIKFIKKQIRNMQRNVEEDMDKRITHIIDILNDKESLAKFEFRDPDDPTKVLKGVEAVVKYLKFNENLNLSLTQVAKILDIIKNNQGKIGAPGLELLNWKLDKFKDQLRDAQKDPSQIETVKFLKADFKTAFKLDDSGRARENAQGLRTHFDKSQTKSLGRKLFSIWTYLLSLAKKVPLRYDERETAMELFNEIERMVGKIGSFEKNKPYKGKKQILPVLKKPDLDVKVAEESSQRPKVKTFLAEPVRPAETKAAREAASSTPKAASVVTPAKPVIPKTATTLASKERVSGGATPSKTAKVAPLPEVAAPKEATARPRSQAITAKAGADSKAAAEKPRSRQATPVESIRTINVAPKAVPVPPTRPAKAVPAGKQEAPSLAPAQSKTLPVAPRVVEVLPAKATPLKPLGLSQPMAPRPTKVAKAPGILTKVASFEELSDKNKKHNVPEKSATQSTPQKSSNVRSQAQLYEEKLRAEEKASAERDKLRRQNAMRQLQKPQTGISPATPTSDEPKPKPDPKPKGTNPTSTK